MCSQAASLTLGSDKRLSAGHEPLVRRIWRIVRSHFRCSPWHAIFFLDKGPTSLFVKGSACLYEVTACEYFSQRLPPMREHEFGFSHPMRMWLYLRREGG